MSRSCPQRARTPTARCRRSRSSRLFADGHVSRVPPVREREVVAVPLVVLVQLPDASESRTVVAELGAAALSEPRRIARQRQLAAVEPDRVDPMDAARVEVLHRKVVLALHHADQAERVGKVGVLVNRTLDQEQATFEPFVSGPPANHRVFDHRVGHLDRPLADQRVERLQLRPGVGLVHSTPSFALRGYCLRYTRNSTARSYLGSPGAPHSRALASGERSPEAGERKARRVRVRPDLGRRSASVDRYRRWFAVAGGQSPLLTCGLT